jgi:hypothetical protein
VKTAKLLTTLPPNDVGAVWKIYELDPPMPTYGEPTKYVVASAVRAMYSGPEVYLFPAVKNGDEFEVSDWSELEGSYRGGLRHDTALENAGYEVTA